MWSLREFGCVLCHSAVASEGLPLWPLLRAMTTEAFCHSYDTAAILFFEFVVYIFDSLPGQIEHFNRTVLLLMIE